MSEYTVTMSSKGRMTIPEAVRRQLGLQSGDKVLIVVEGDRAKIQRLHQSGDVVHGIVPALPGVEAGDFDELIDEAMEDHATSVIARIHQESA